MSAMRRVSRLEVTPGTIGIWIQEKHAVRQQFGSERERGSGTHGSGQELEACVEIEVFGLKKVSAGSLS